MTEYLYLAPYTFFWHNRDTVLLYNSLNGKSEMFDTDDELNSMLTSLGDIKEMYCISLNGKIKSKKVSYFVDRIKEKGYGGIVLSETSIKPIVIPPIPIVLKSPDNMSDGYRSLLKVLVINLHKNGSVINWHDLEKCLDDLPLSVEELIITGDNPLFYREWYSLERKLERMVQVKTIVLTLPAYYYIMEINDFNICSSFKIELDICLFQVGKKTIERIINNSQRLSNRIKYLFYISSEEEYENAELLIDRFSLGRTEIRPKFNGCNLDFLERNVFLTKEDIVNQNLSGREISRNQLVNTNYFGRLTITADGKVYANVNMKPLGKIDDSFEDLINREFDRGDSWFRTRDKVEPCIDCLFRHLCPSPSDYEIEIGRYNMCNVEVIP